MLNAGHSLRGDLSMSSRERPAKPESKPVLSLRAHEDMARDILSEAKKRKLRVSEELRRRLEFYATNAKMLEVH
jgi:hypothetical protein